MSERFPYVDLDAVVHRWRQGKDIDADFRALLAEVKRLRKEKTYLITQYETLLEIHAHVVMDTDEDRELHARAIAAMREALAKITGAG